MPGTNLQISSQVGRYYIFSKLGIEAAISCRPPFAHSAIKLVKM